MPAAGPTGFDLERRYVLHPQVAVRPEPFGALLYHFGTRRLSFLKDPRLLEVVRGLAEAPTAHAACTAAGVGEDELARFVLALATLAETDMLEVT
jgi:mycofactocin biosynthesis protein MftB